MTDTACAQPFTCCFFFWGGESEEEKTIYRFLYFVTFQKIHNILIFK